ncbi:MAG: inorganic phosphate transporter [Xanthomonadales bacterium]|nr:inorganic phosphate transporter [Xanthomonadales bacterium]
MDFYLLALIVLLLIAVLDLSVGVANDAVNFLNSAIGSRAASLRTLSLLAAVGLILGSLLSSGMMEVARSGIFQPAAFSFDEVMVIFVAVMVADVLLLDAFNTMGLPTSTTVSVVFELLGAALLVALLKMAVLNQSAGALDSYLNAGNALRIISGIFISIAVAFVVGTVVQWCTRLLFTFRPNQQGRWLHALWAALALALISDFLLVKTLAQSGLLPTRWLDWSTAHPLATLLLLGLAGLALTEAGWRLHRLEPTRLVVLVGTLALATAFASNDLVNFLGVPLAGLTAYQDWLASGQPAADHGMAVLANPVRGQTWLMLAGGAIMALTLWLSSKARSVTETEVNLGRQGQGSERFRPGPLSRGLVRLSLWLFQILHPLLPQTLRARIERRFETEPAGAPLPENDRPAFDLVRGSVNLTVASSLIALATLWKLPLSTTFVSFMVAMGSSLADRSWGRDSAVYRIAGVASVIGGWFLTALIAFSTAALFALVLWYLRTAGLLLLLGLVIATLLLSGRWHRRRQAQTSIQVPLAERSEALFVTLADVLAASASLRPTALASQLRRCRQWRRRQIDSRSGFSLARSMDDPERGDALVRLLRNEKRLLALVEGMLERLVEHHRDLLTPLAPGQVQRLRSCLELVSQAIRHPAERDSCATLRAAAIASMQQTRLTELKAGDLVADSPGRLLLNLTDDLLELLTLAEAIAQWRLKVGLSDASRPSEDANPLLSAA